jgi:hypothetical protein
VPSAAETLNRRSKTLLFFHKGEQDAKERIFISKAFQGYSYINSDFNGFAERYGRGLRFKQDASVDGPAEYGIRQLR